MKIDRDQIGEGQLSEEQEIYRENILDHYKHPHNFGALLHYSFKHRELNPLCGDEIELFVALEEGRVENVGFRGKGCAISQACMSMLSEEIKKKNLGEVKETQQDDILKMLGIRVGVVRMKCALLPLKTLHRGIEAFENNGKNTTH